MGLLTVVVVFSVLLFFTIVLKKSLLVSAAISLLVTIILNIFFFGAIKGMFLLAVITGLLISAEISLLVFGALLFYNYLKSTGFIENLENSLRPFSTNKLVIAILLAFFFGSFIEGVSGFGIPAMIIAPLLLGLRFPAYIAASLALFANTIPVIFGAVGTPIKIGFAGLPTDQVPVYAALLLTLPALFLPFIFKRFLSRNNLLVKDESSFKVNLITLMAGVAFVIPFVFFSQYNPDFPSIAASIIGLVIWLAVVKSTGSVLANVSYVSLKQFFITFRPYLFIALLIVAAKVLLGNLKLSIIWKDIDLERSISLFQPGLVFIIGLLILNTFSRKKGTDLKRIVKDTAIRLPATFASIACLAIMARLLSQNLNIYEYFGDEPIPAPFLNILAVASGFGGSFMAGSATMSNLMFGREWYSAGQQYGFNTSLLLASQLAGAAIGNALSVQNIAMVQAVIDEKRLESMIFKKLWKPVFLFFLLIGLAAFCLAVLPDIF